MHKTIRLCAIVFLAWFAAAALTPLTSVAIRNSTVDSTTIGAGTPAAGSFTSVKDSYSVTSGQAPNPAATNTLSMGWNAQVIGESDFVNHHGTGAGAFNWYDTSSAAGGVWNASAPIMHLGAAGGLTSAGGYSTPSTVTASGGFIGNLTGNVSGTLTGNVVGNASTATQLAANPSNCPAGKAATGIQANGTADCAPLANVLPGIGTTCTTGGSSFSTCTSTVTWGSGGFADTNYEASCTLGAPTDPRAYISGIASKSTTTAQVTVVTAGSIAVSFNSLNCIAIHN